MVDRGVKQMNINKLAPLNKMLHIRKCSLGMKLNWMSYGK